MEPIPSALSPATRRAATYLPYLSPELVEPRGIEPLTFALRGEGMRCQKQSVPAIIPQVSRFPLHQSPLIAIVTL